MKIRKIGLFLILLLFCTSVFASSNYSESEKEFVEVAVKGFQSIIAQNKVNDLKGESFKNQYVLILEKEHRLSHLTIRQHDESSQEIDILTVSEINASLEDYSTSSGIGMYVMVYLDMTYPSKQLIFQNNLKGEDVSLVFGKENSDKIKENFGKLVASVFENAGVTEESRAGYAVLRGNYNFSSYRAKSFAQRALQLKGGKFNNPELVERIYDRRKGEGKLLGEQFFKELQSNVEIIRQYIEDEVKAIPVIVEEDLNRLTWSKEFKARRDLIGFTAELSQLEMATNVLKMEEVENDKVVIADFVGIGGKRLLISQEDLMVAAVKKMADKIHVNITNAKTSSIIRNNLKAGKNHNGVDVGENDVIVWIDFTEKEQLIRLWFPLNQETENYISYNDLWSEIFLNLPDQMNADVESLQELLSVELVITKSISSFLKGSMIPPKVWDDKDPQYLFNVIPEEIWTSEAKAYFAAQCGLYDGFVNEVKGIADFVTLVCEVIVDKKKRYKTSKMIGDLELLAVWDGVCSLTSKHFETLSKLDCRAAHLAGKDVAAIISAFIPITKVGTAAKSGKFFSEMASLTAKEMKKTVLAVKNFPKTVVLKTKDLTKGIVDLFYGSKRIGEIRSGVLYPAKIADAHIIDGKFDRLSKEVIDQNGDPLVLTKSLDGEHHFCHTDGSCFIAGTLVKTDQGEKAIEAIKIGDQVWSYNESKGSEELKEVTRVKKRFTNEIIKIQAGVEEITTTPEHPFYIEGRWVSAEELKIGDWLWLYNRRKIAIDNLTKVDSSATVYNFTVKGNGNYYVGEDGVLVHNEYVKVDLDYVLASLPLSFQTKITAIKDVSTKNALLKQLGVEKWRKDFVEGGEGMVDAWEVVKNLPDEIKLNPSDLRIISDYLGRSEKSIDEVIKEIPHSGLDQSRMWLGERKIEPFLDTNPNVTSIKAPTGYQIYQVNNSKYIRRSDIKNPYTPRLMVGINDAVLRYSKPVRMSTNGKLRSNLESDLGYIPANHQAHHLISDNVVKKSALYAEALSRNRTDKLFYDIDRATNGKFLAETAADYKDVNGKFVSDSYLYPTHNGSHPIYDDLISQKIIDTEIRLKNEFGSLDVVPDDVLQLELELLEKEAVLILEKWVSSRLN